MLGMGSDWSGCRTGTGAGVGRPEKTLSARRPDSTAKESAGRALDSHLRCD